MPVRACSMSPPTASPAPVVFISAVSSIGNGLSPARDARGAPLPAPLAPPRLGGGSAVRQCVATQYTYAVPERLAPEVWTIVHDVTPVGSPSLSERYDAVTEPWIWYPPLSATYPAGQSVVNCLLPERCESVEVMIAEPSSPGLPSGRGGPAGPAGPAGPIAPCSPWGRAAPPAPASPFGPVAPAAPASPFEPAGPTGPAGPALP